MPAKKDTRLKHTDDLADEYDPKYINLAQFTTSTGIDSKGMAEANTIIDEWLEQHAPDLKAFTTNASRERVKPLVQELYNHFAPFFADKSATFIKSTLETLIRRNPYNKRRKVKPHDFDDGEATARNMVRSSSTNTPGRAKVDVQTTTSTPIQPRDIAMIADADTYGIRAKRVLQSGVIGGYSPATVIDVTPPDATRERDICGQISFDMWMDILREDLQYTSLDTINYEFGDIESEIIGDRKFRAAVIDARERRQPHAVFEVISRVRDRKLNCLSNSSVHLITLY